MLLNNVTIQRWLKRLFFVICIVLLPCPFHSHCSIGRLKTLNYYFQNPAPTLPPPTQSSLYRMYSELQVQMGSVLFVQLSLILPVYQRPCAVVWGYLGGKRTQKGIPESNVGLGILESNVGLGCRLQGEQGVWGIWGYWDCKGMAQQQNIHQFTSSLEYCTPTVEARVNGYFPIKNQVLATQKGKKEIDIDPLGDITKVQTVYKVTALPGGELEAGGSLHENKLQVFGAYYCCITPDATPPVQGIRLRCKVNPTNWLSVLLGGSYDRLQARSVSLGITLNSASLFKSPVSLTVLEKKMTQMPVRGLDTIYFVPKEMKTLKSATYFSEKIDKKLKKMVAPIPPERPYEQGTAGQFSQDMAMAALEKILQAARENNGQQNFSEVQPAALTPLDRIKQSIEWARKEADQERGITWRIAGDTLIKDARRANGKPFSKYDYLTQILNEYRAGLIISESIFDQEQGTPIMEEVINEKKRKKDKKLYEWLLGALDKWNKISGDDEKKYVQFRQQVKNEFNKLIKTDFYPNVSKTKIEEIVKDTSNFAGFYDTHYDVTTIVPIPGTDQCFFLKDTKITALTEKQKQSFLDRKNQAWYKALPEYKQKLVDRFIRYILDGKHVLPTQIRDIPGLRNGYLKEVQCYDKDGKLVTINSYFHHGTIASFSEDPAVRVEMTSENFKVLLGLDPKIKVVSLNSNFKLGSYEAEKIIIELTKQVTGEHFHNIATNLLRKVTSNDFAEKTYQELKGLTEHMPPSPLLEAVQFLLKNVKDDSFKNKIEKIFEKNENKNLRMAAFVVALSNELSQHGLGNVAVSCKSGKDRTGLTCFLADIRSILYRYPEIKKDPKKLDELYKNFAMSGHYQFLAGCNGGTPGCYGLKPVACDWHDVLGDDTVRLLETLLFPLSARQTG